MGWPGAGVRFLDAQGAPLSAGGEFVSPARIDLQHRDPQLKACRIDVACDVDNPAAGWPARQLKIQPAERATAKMVERLEEGCSTMPMMLQTLTGEDVAQVAGGGAAGGMGIAAVIFLQASMKPRIEIVLQAVYSWSRQSQDAALVITRRRTY